MYINGFLLCMLVVLASSFKSLDDVNKLIYQQKMESYVKSLVTYPTKINYIFRKSIIRIENEQENINWTSVITKVIHHANKLIYQQKMESYVKSLVTYQTKIDYIFRKAIIQIENEQEKIDWTSVIIKVIHHPNIQIIYPVVLLEEILWIVANISKEMIIDNCDEVVIHYKGFYLLRITNTRYNYKLSAFIETDTYSDMVTTFIETYTCTDIDCAIHGLFDYLVNLIFNIFSLLWEGSYKRF